MYDLNIDDTQNGIFVNHMVDKTRTIRYNTHAMKSLGPKKRSERRPDYTSLGSFLRDARISVPDPDTRNTRTVNDVAHALEVTAAFVYQVEQGKRKPKNGCLGRWASVYGVRYVDLYKCLGLIPMDLVASYRREPAPASPPIPVDPFSELSEREKVALLPYLYFIRATMGPYASLID